MTTAAPSGSWPAGTEVIDAVGPHRAARAHRLPRPSRLPRLRAREALGARRAALDRGISGRRPSLRQILESGYTAIRDAGGLDAGFRVAIQEGLIPGPRLVLSLAIISPTGGLGDRVSPSGHRAPADSDPSLPSSVADGVEAVRTTVRTMVRAGADVIKCATTGGASSRAGHGPKDSGVHARGDESARRRGARARAPRDVPRARRSRAARRDRGRRRFDRARLLSRRGPRADPDDGRARTSSTSRR